MNNFCHGNRGCYRIKKNRSCDGNVISIFYLISIASNLILHFAYSVHILPFPHVRIPINIHPFRKFVLPRCYHYGNVPQVVSLQCKNFLCICVFYNCHAMCMSHLRILGVTEFWVEIYEWIYTGPHHELVINLWVR